jgi:peptide/nickel transport system substrate-binding protein
LDLGRDELLYSDVKGRNPFKDLRVRQALYQAIDVLALQRQVMRGASIPTTIALSDPVGAGVSPDLDRPRSFDPESAKRLLKAAGYPEGFGFTLHCPTDRVANGEKLCTALAAMWARIGVKVAPETPPRATFLAKVLAGDISAYLTSWGGALSDAIFVLAPVFHSPTNPRWGQGNHGNVKIERLDALIEAIDTEMNASKRQRLIEEAVMLLQSELPVIPLHRQVIPWVSRSNVSVVHSPDNRLNMIWVRVR